MFGFGFVDNISQRTIYAKTSSNNYGWTNGGQNVQPLGRVRGKRWTKLDKWKFGLDVNKG